MCLNDIFTHGNDRCCDNYENSIFLPPENDAIKDL